MKRLPGLISLLLILTAMWMGGWFAWQKGILWGALFTALFLGGWVIIISFFCAKCPCREKHCAHILPGAISRLFKPKKPGPYTKSELAISILAVGAMLLFSQTFLISRGIWQILSWILIGIALPLQMLTGCPNCGNSYCPLNTTK